MDFQWLFTTFMWNYWTVIYWKQLTIVIASLTAGWLRKFLHFVIFSFNINYVELLHFHQYVPALTDMNRSWQGDIILLLEVLRVTLFQWTQDTGTRNADTKTQRSRFKHLISLLIINEFLSYHSYYRRRNNYKY